MRNLIIKILITTNGESLKLIDAYTGDLTGELRSNNAKMTKACYTPDGSMVIAGDDSGGVTLYDAKRSQVVSNNLYCPVILRYRQLKFKSMR